jgi:hypothetical protein
MRRALLLSLVGLAGAGCGGASSDPGLSAYMRAANAQFVPGSLTADTTATGPKIQSINILTTRVAPGLENLSLTGDVTDGTSALIGLAGDTGYWIVPTTVSDVLSPGSYQFSTKLSFSPALPLGNQSLIMRGVDAKGQVGPSLTFKVTVAAPVPSSALTIALAWDTESDMDLHVLVPNPSDPAKPIEIYNKNPVGLAPQPAGTPPLTDDEMTAAVAAAGKLDFDSNAACVIDGRRQENVVFAMPPPSGTYSVLVDAFSLCGQPDAQWQVSATTADGTVLGSAQWEATEFDTRGSHGAGAGRLAFTFSIP